TALATLPVTAYPVGVAIGAIPAATIIKSIGLFFSSRRRHTSFELRAKVEECFGVKYDFAGGIIFEIQKHHNPQSPNLQTIEPAVLPLNLVHQYGISQDVAEIFYNGLTISRNNKLTIEEAILKPHSTKRFMFRPILVYNIGGEERALVGKEKFVESVIVLSTNAIHWNAMYEEW